MNFMEIAIKEAKKALNANEVPVGAVIVKNNSVISTGYNLVEQKKSSLYHAELIAIKKAQGFLNNWRLNDCILYVTLEPCLMCTGAIINSRIKKVVFALREEKFGAIVSKIKINEIKFNHCFDFFIDETYANEVKNLMQLFFRSKR